MLKRLKVLLNEANADYFVAFDWQISFAYFFNNYLNKDIYAIAYDGSKAIKNPVLENLKGKKIAMYLGDVPYKKMVLLKKKFKLKDLTKQIDEMRVIKSAQEIEKIKKACKITASILRDIEIGFNEVANASEKDIAKKIKQYYVDKEVEEAFPTIVAYDKNAYVLHHKPQNTNNPQDIVLIDTGAKYSGYNADMSTTLSISKRAQKVKEDVLHVLELIEDAIYDGVDVKSITEYAKNLLSQYGKASFHNHHLLGHGIGIEVHEDPSFKEKNTILRKNMTIALEPGVYVKNKYGVRIENTYVIKKKKAKKLC